MLQLREYVKESLQLLIFRTLFQGVSHHLDAVLDQT